ncbi:MAG: hypothetical protein GY760_08195 [Deltaproteobacteria bacterium]|nr:hypothetical protein [Deltaproteobacteria bacterium]
MIITKKGLDILALMNVDIEFVRAEIGNGELSGDPLVLTGLISKKMDVQINNREFVGDETLCVTISFTNTDVTEGFYVHELGLYIRDPEGGSDDILFCYDYVVDANFLPDNTSPTGVEHVHKFYMKMSNTEGISISIPSEGYILRENFGANTIFKADIDGDPELLEVSEDTIIGRHLGTNIKALFPDEIRNITNKGTNKSVLNGGVQITELNSGILQSDESGNVSSKSVASNTIVGKSDSGNIDDLSANQVRTIINTASNDSVLNGSVKISDLNTGVLHSDESGNVSSKPIVPTSSVRQAVLSYGNGIEATGKIINIKADTDNPFVASIADGFSGTVCQKNILISEVVNKILSFSEEDGNYTLTVDEAKNYTLETSRPFFDSTPGVMKGVKKLPIADVTVLDGSINIDLMPVGDSYESEWFPVEKNSLYSLKNKFKDTRVNFDIWWNDTPSDENMRHVSGQHYYDGVSRGLGAYKRINSNELIVGSGTDHTFHSGSSGDPASSSNGYYKITVRRKW